MPVSLFTKRYIAHRQHRWRFLGLCLLIGTVCCDKDSENGPRPRERHFDLKNECKNYTTTSGFGFTYLLKGMLYDQPRFNPHDPDELIYHEYNESFSRLMKYRLSTREKTVFLDPIPANIELDWGRGGWLAFSNYADVYLISEEGGDAYKVPLTSEGHSCAEPDWNPDGTVVGFPFGGVDGISLYGEYLLYDIESNRVDTFNSYREVLRNTRPLSWSSKNEMSKWTGTKTDPPHGLSAVNMTTKRESHIFSYDDRKWLDTGEGSSDMMWNDGGTQLYYTGGNITCFYRDEYKEIRIKKGCESRYYEDITISPDDQYIVVERVNVTRPNRFESTLVEEHKLYIMDIDGCNERPLLDE